MKKTKVDTVKAEAPPKAAVAMSVVQSSTIALGTIVNPVNDDHITVEDLNGNPTQATTGYPLSTGDTVFLAPEATGSIVGVDVDNNPVTIASFAGDTVDIGWDEVISVDEYYNGSGFSWDLSIDADNSFVITVAG